MIAPGDLPRQRAGVREVDRDRVGLDSEHLADHPPAVVVVLRLLVVDTNAELAQRVDDDPGERQQRADQVVRT